MGARIEALRGALPDAARDIRLNLQSVLTAGGALSEAQRWGVALAAALSARNAELSAAVSADALAHAGEAVVEEARAAAALMAMNNVFYRFRHVIDKPVYATKPARLRMNRLGQPSTNKADLELFSLAASAINGCEACVRAHEKAVLDGGLTEDHVHDAIRIASTIQAAAVALEMCGAASDTQLVAATGD